MHLVHNKHSDDDDGDLFVFRCVAKTEYLFPTITINARYNMPLWESSLSVNVYSWQVQPRAIAPPPSTLSGNEALRWNAFAVSDGFWFAACKVQAAHFKAWALKEHTLSYTHMSLAAKIWTFDETQLRFTLVSVTFRQKSLHHQTIAEKARAAAASAAR